MNEFTEQDWREQLVAAIREQLDSPSLLAPEQSPLIILKTVRAILGTKEGESVLGRALTVARRYEQMCRELGRTEWL